MAGAGLVAVVGALGAGADGLAAAAVFRAEVLVTAGKTQFPSWALEYLSLQEVEKLEALVAEIEKKTEGEIVPVLVRQSVIEKVSALAWLPFLRPWFYSKSYLGMSADLRAELEFYRARVYHTQKKTGILLFISFFERRAVVLADKGIADLLPANTWDQVVQHLTSGVKQGRLYEGFSKAISQCGEILIQHFPQKDPDQNQLANRIQVKD